MDSPFPRSPATMSRRSLRLHEPPPEHASHYGSASFSVGMPLRREPTSSKSSRRPQLSVSCSQSLLRSPRRHDLHHHHSSLHSVASDASLLSSMLDESSIQERTVVDSLWGLDDDGEPHESTIVSENSAALANSTLIAGGDDRCHGHPAQTQTSMVNGYPCRDCSVPSDRMEALHSSSRFPHVTSRATGAVALTSAFSGAQTQEQSAATSPTSTIYCRDKSRKGKMGVFLSVWDSVRSVCRRMAASLTLLLTLIYKHMLFKKSLDHEGALQWMLAVSKEATASAVSLLTLGVQVVRRLASRAGDKWPPRPAAHWGFGTWFNRASSRSGGNMESDGPGDKNLNQSGSRSGVSKDKRSEQPAVASSSSSPSSPSPPSSSSTSLASSLLSSVLYFLLGVLWIAATTAGAYLWPLARRAGSAGWVVIKKRVSELRSSSPSAGQVGSSVLRWLKRGWSHTVSFMSVLKNFLLVRCLPNLFKITLLLFLLILLSVLLGWWDPREVLSSMLPVDGTDWRDALPLASIPGLAALLKPPQETSSQSAPDTPEQSTDLQAYAEQPPPAPPSLPPPMQTEEEAAEGKVEEEEAEEEDAEGEEESDEASPRDSERLQRLEQSMSELWERVEASGHRAEQMHGEVLGLYQGLRQELALQVQAEPDRGDVLEPWLDGLLEDKLAEMRGRLEEDRLHREQTRKQYMAQQKSQAIRLAELEQLLQALTTKMERVQQRQEAVTKATTTTYQQSSVSRPPTSVGSMDSESHDALRSDVSRLEVALGGVRQDLKGLRGCQGHCDHLDDVQETIFSRVRAQVREELRALLYGNQLVPLSKAVSTEDDNDDDNDDDDQAAFTDSLLQWLAERYVSGADLRASLASLELSILHNVSQLLQQQQRHEEPANNGHGDDDDDDHHQTVVTRAVAESLDAAGAGVTEEQVQLMVRDALRLYSEDRTGLADYALESGGGSILSTRCSESYETRTAVLSLFGLPLWYFSQSPRAVIQPDVHPGNCWAFRGSTGYLVVRLSMKVVPVAFSLEHIPKALAPSGALRSAPRDFTVHGLDNEGHQDGKLLGTYSYEEDGEALQTYHVTEENEQAYQIIEVRILSNWGNPDYTCMYRLRVHGRPSDD